MTTHLVDQLDHGFAGGAWHGPAVFELLRDVDAARAAARTPGQHTIWELTLHIAVWLDAVRRRTLGDPALVETEAANFPAIPDLSASAWSAAQQRLRDALRGLRDVIGTLSDADLSRPVAQQSYDLHFMLDGAIQHSLYHAGQIALLLKPRPDSERDFLRHTLATLAYRAEKSLRAPPAGFATLRLGPATRTPLQIVGHLGDLIEWAATFTDGPPTWKAASRGDWERDVARFFAALARLDQRLASAAPLAHPAATLFQGPIADALTHVGQLALLRGAAGAPVRPESFARAEIAAGRVGADQSSARKEFDGDASASAPSG